MQQNIYRPPDESLATDILELVCGLTQFLPLCVFGLLLLQYNLLDARAYGLPLLLLISGTVAHALYRRGLFYTTSRVIAYTYGLLPIATIVFFGLEKNSFIYFSALGVILAALLLSTAKMFTLAGWALLLCVIAVIAIHADVGTAVNTLIALALLLLSTAIVSAMAGATIRGTIEWALDTARKSERREGLLRATQEDLQQAIGQRDRLNAALQKVNQELDAARLAAEAAYRSKSSFMAAMSHELRTPLNLIIGFSSAMLEHPEMYEDQPLSEVYCEDLAVIQRSGKHLLGLINDILDLAKMEAGRLELHKTHLALEPLLEEMLRSASGLLKNSRVTLVCEFDHELPPVLADEARVRQVLLNLLSNACKFTDRGIIALGARVAHGSVLLWVRDSGIGIAPSDQERIFGQFEQVETEENRYRGGTGLGLSICRWLVEMHGGRMGVKSEQGRGSVFYFTLPVVAGADEDAPLDLLEAVAPIANTSVPAPLSSWPNGGASKK